jgi:hypothetical protein
MISLDIIIFVDLCHYQIFKILIEYFCFEPGIIHPQEDLGFLVGVDNYVPIAGVRVSSLYRFGDFFFSFFDKSYLRKQLKNM